MLVYGVRALIALIIRGWLRIYHRFEIIGHENLRTNRSLVIVANHSSHLDTLCLLAALPLGKLHRAFPAAAADYFFQSVPRTFVPPWLPMRCPLRGEFAFAGASPSARNFSADPENILIIFPEGTRSKTGETREFKSGIGALVAGRDVTVLRLLFAGRFSRVAEGQSSTASEKSSTHCWRASQLFVAQQTRSTSAQSQRNCIAR